MRFISLQKLSARRYNKTVPKPDDTLRRFLAMTFAADRIVDLAAWEAEWTAVWENTSTGRPQKPLPRILDDLLMDPKACAAVLKDAKALCPDRAPDEWATLMEKWATNPWLSAKTAVFETNGPQILQDAGLVDVVGASTDPDVPE